MQIKVEKRKTIIQGILGLTVMLGVIRLSAIMDGASISANSLQAMNLLAGIICVAVSFAVFAQGWILFTNNLSGRRLYSAVLFSILGTLDVFHIATFSGIHIFGFEPNNSLSMWFLLLSHALGALGLLFIFSFPDREISQRHKVLVFLGAAVLNLGTIFILYIYQKQLPTLFGVNGIGVFERVSQVAIPILYGLGICAIMYIHRKERPAAALTVVTALVFMMLGHILLTFVDPLGTGLEHAIGEWCMGISYYFVLKGVYKLTIEDPFQGQLIIEAQMKHMAYYDDLTGLPNLRKMRECLGGSLESCGEGSNRIGVAVININRFKAINDSLGYSAGDKLLTEVGERLSDLCSPSEVIYRMGEDEFAIVIHGYGDVEAVEMRAEQLLGSVNPAVMIDKTEYHISLSMGLSIFPEDGDSVDQMIQYADMAVHSAKELGLDFIRYTPAMKLRTQSKVELENDMRKGLDRGEFFLEFQPQVSLDSGNTVGMEALVRWNHPTRGLLSPGEFIPLAEESGLIVPLGEWVLRTACQHNKQWQDEGYEPICVSVNLSMRQFRQYNLADRVDMILKEVGLEACYLELEITETMTFDIDTAFEQLHSLKRLGLYISIDDFGTGYSSLYYLKTLPIDRLKIDRSFVKEVMLDGNDAAIVSTITTMAHHLKLKVTAEGVESKDQLEFLKLQNCHEGQGFLFSKPVPAGVFESQFLTRLVG
ncbi:putative bifunctional diguanylate cyclase/phosphodiesterase [Paenibacillus sp. FSL K6-2524]|uniref:putative bifunctional diguanylate cyclase/phosphodiesterase n=1 Tax=Paenibacillus sp. FSL K6-2524 TaxID=2954516 RepID=UPI0030F60875